MLQPGNRRFSDAGKNIGKPRLRIDVVELCRHAQWGEAAAYNVTARLLPWRICFDAGDKFFVVDKAVEEVVPFLG